MGLRQCCKLHTALVDSYRHNSFPTHTQHIQTAHRQHHPGCGKTFDVTNFNRTWDSYVIGFGKLYHEHWLGLDKIHCLTASKGRAELYVDMYDCDGVRKYARYSYFHVEGSSVNYTLHYSGYSGTAGDSLATHRLHQLIQGIMILTNH